MSDSGDCLDDGLPGLAVVSDSDDEQTQEFDPNGIVMVKGGTQRPHFAAAVNAGASAAATSASTFNRMYLIAHGIKSKNNIGELLRTAGAMGAAEVLVTSPHTSKSKARRSLSTFGAHGSDRRVVVRCFLSFEVLVAWLRRQHIFLCGIEIKPEAVSIDRPGCFDRPLSFTGGVCFMPGNEGTGLVPAHANACDGFVYIPHFGAATASLNVNAATAVVLHAFASTAPEGFAEVPREGEKFVVDDQPRL